MKPPAARPATLPRFLLGLYSSLYLVFLYLPVLMLPLFSLNRSTYAAFPFRGPTLRWYGQLWDDTGIKAALLHSLSVALPASLLAVAAGTACAYVLVRGGGWIANLVAVLSLAPILIPGVVLGIALLIEARVLGLYPSLPVVAAGHAVLCMPLCLIIMRSHFRVTTPSIEEAALDLGASRIAMLWRIVLPVAWPSLLACLILCFTSSMDEFVVSFFLVGTSQTLPLFIWDHLRFPLQLPRMMALGTLILLLSVALAIVGDRLTLRRQHPPAAPARG